MKDSSTKCSGIFLCPLSTINPIQQVLDAEEQAEAILEEARRFKKETLETAKKDAEKIIEKAEAKKKEEIGQKIQQEKDSVQKKYREEVEKIRKRGEAIEAIADKKTSEAVNMVIAAFVAHFQKA